MQSRHMNINNKWLWKTDKFFGSAANSHTRPAKKRKLLKPPRRYTWSASFWNIFVTRIQVEFTSSPGRWRCSAVVQSVFIHYCTSFSWADVNVNLLWVQHETRYQSFTWLSRLNQKVQTVSAPADGLHGLLVAGILQVHAAHLKKGRTAMEWCQSGATISSAISLRKTKIMPFTPAVDPYSAVSSFQNYNKTVFLLH